MWQEKFSKQLQEYKAEKFWREREVIDKREGVFVEMNGRPNLQFSSSDYLSLTTDPEVVEAFSNATKKYGFGSGASPMVSGYTHPQQALEEEFADFVKRDKAVFFFKWICRKLRFIFSTFFKQRYYFV